MKRLQALVISSLFIVAACDARDAATLTVEPTVLRYALTEPVELPWPNMPGPAGELAGFPATHPIVAAADGSGSLPVITFSFSRPVSSETLAPGINLVVLDAAALPVTFTVETVDARHFRLHPMAPLAPAARYTVLATKSILDLDRRPVEEDILFRLLRGEAPLIDRGRVQSEILLFEGYSPAMASLAESLRRSVRRAWYGSDATAAALQRLAREDLARFRHTSPGAPEARDVEAHVAAVWQFATGNGASVATMDAARAQTVAHAESGGVTLDSVLDTPAAVGELFARFGDDRKHGYVHTVIRGRIRSLALFTGARRDGAPESGTVVERPFYLAYPPAVTAGPVPVVLLAHDFGGCALDALTGLANVLASRGMASLALELPAHGLRASVNSAGENDFDPIGPCDGKTPQEERIASGEGFPTAASPLLLRDALRQTALDFIAAVETAQRGSLNRFHAGGDLSDVRFAGVGLGASVGISLLAAEPRIGAAALHGPGASLARMLDASTPWRPALLAPGLAGAEDAAHRLLPMLQAALDPAEPALFAPRLRGRPVLLQEIEADTVVGDFGAALVADLAGIPERFGPVYAGAGPSRVLFGDEAFHGLLIALGDTDDPQGHLAAARTAMQGQLATYLETDGDVLE